MGDQHQVHVWENTYIMQPKVGRIPMVLVGEEVGLLGFCFFTSPVLVDSLGRNQVGNPLEYPHTPYHYLLGTSKASQDNEKMLPSKVTAVIKNVMESYLQVGGYIIR